MKTIPIGSGKEALVDDCDYESASSLKWYYHKRFHSEYAIANIPREGGGRTTIELHRFILKTPKGVRVDHRDRNGLNCQRENLREATKAQNGRNTSFPEKNKWGFKGVRKTTFGSRWEVQIQTDFGRITLGAIDLEEAVKIYDAMCLEFHGEFAIPNIT